MSAELEQTGKFIAAGIKTARKYEAAAKDKAGTDLEKANNHWIAATQRLAEARKLCAEADQSFKEFKKKWAPDLSRATLYRVIAIGSGKIDVEEQRKSWREEKREKRAAAKESRTITLSETLPAPVNGQNPAAREEGVVKALPGSIEVPIEEHKAYYDDAPTTALAPEPEPVPEPELISAPEPATVAPQQAVSLSIETGGSAFAEFKRACDICLPLMSEDERKAARVYHNEWKEKRKRKMAA